MPFFFTLLLQFSSVAHSCLTLCDPMDGSTPGLLVHYQLLQLAQTHVHRVSDAIQPSHPLLSLLLLPSVFPSIRVSSNESLLCIRWPKYWTFSFSILVIVFLPRSKRLLILWLQSPSSVILEPKKIKSDIVFPSICHEVMGPRAMILVF